MDWDYDDFEDDDLELTLEEEIEMVNEAYNNAYLVVTKKATVQELIDDAKDFMFLPFDPDAPETLELIMDDMIIYFEDNEEYEKCSELMKIKNNDSE